MRKGIAVPTFAALNGRPERQAIEVEWEQMLAHQLPVCPPFAEFWDELPRVFEWLAAGEAPKPLPAIGAAIRVPAGGLDASWHAPSMGVRWGLETPIEAIRFAGANHLLVDLDYESENGERRRRVIEPYALRRSGAGDILLYAVRVEDGDTRSYRVDRIRGATVLQKSFRPRFAVELSPGASLQSLPAVKDGGSVREAAIVRTLAPFSRGKVKSPCAKATRLGPAIGPTYVFECPLCGKRFSRRKWDAKLNPHKNPAGWNCPSRTGIYRETNRG